MIVRGELYTADLDPVVGSEQGGMRPVLVVQNDVGNRFSPTVVVLALTSQIDKARLPTHVLVSGSGLARPSVVLAEQMRTLDKRRLRDRIGMLPPEAMEKVNQALPGGRRIVFGRLLYPWMEALLFWQDMWYNAGEPDGEGKRDV